MLQPLGITYKMIKKLIEEEPNPTLLKQQLQDNPYIMTKIHGLGFKRIDALALKLKPELLISIHRLVAYVYYYFTELGEDEGYTWVSFDRLKDNVSNNVPECISLFNDMLQMNDFIYYDKDSDRIGLKKFRDIEVEIFNILYSKSLYVNTKISFTDEEIVKAIKQAEEEQGYTYSEEQNEVITNTLKQNISIITGCAGTGKTSISRAIFIAYQNKHYSMALSALSAKASKRITEATGFPAVTIHRTLGCTGFNKFAFNKDCKMITDLAFMDEASMTNARLFYDWLVSIKDDTRIILCGDHKQLPPIGYGNVFSDLIEYTEILNVNILSKPMRQALESGILSDANLIRENINPLTKIEPKIITGNLQDMYYIFRENRDNLQSIAINTYLKSIETDGLDEVIIVTPRKEDCLNSSREINKIIQDKLLGHEKLFIDKGDMKFYKGAKVIQRVNNYEKKIFNGDIGYITDIYTKTVGKLEKQFCQITFNDCSTGNQILEYEKNELDQIDFAYALTVHLCQGSGYKTVIGIIDMTHYKLLDSTMLYTLLTRAKKRCCLLAEPNAFFQCLRTSHNQRCTWLKELKNEKIFENNFKKPIDIHF
jgi:exodeoxyribonuclease V alpha subunit